MTRPNFSSPLTENLTAVPILNDAVGGAATAGTAAVGAAAVGTVAGPVGGAATVGTAAVGAAAVGTVAGPVGGAAAVGTAAVGAATVGTVAGPNQSLSSIVLKHGISSSPSTRFSRNSRCGTVRSLDRRSRAQAYVG